MFITGLVHTKDHGQGFRLLSRNLSRSKGGRVILMPWVRGVYIYVCVYVCVCVCVYVCVYLWGSSAPLGAPGGPQVKSKDFSCTTSLYHCKHNHKKAISFSLIRCKLSFLLLIIIIIRLHEWAWKWYKGIRSTWCQLLHFHNVIIISQVIT